MAITIKHLEDNIKTLPEDLYDEVNDFVDFLKFKYSTNDNQIDLQNWQKEILDDRLNNLDENPTQTVEFNETVAELRKKYS